MGKVIRKQPIAYVVMLSALLSVTACSTVSLKEGSKGGGYYQNDGPGDVSPESLMDTPDAQPKIEPYNQRANAPYTVFGKTYTPMTDDRPYKEQGTASWYGKQYHNKVTSSGDVYNMYAMSAAHPTLPIPSYARVTNVSNGKKVIVRVNDRGPFHSGRIIDLSYTAALKLGIVSNGSGEVIVERILPSEIQQMNGNVSGGAQLGTISAGSVQVSELPNMTPMPPVTQSSSAVTSTPASVQATPSVAPAAPAASSASAAVGKGFYLQFGAFSQEANAQQAKLKLQQSLGAAVNSLDVVSVNGFYRVMSSAYASRQAAQQAANQAQQKGNTPIVVER